MRIITGLAFPTSGKISLWGSSDERGIQEQRKRIGCIIENPALYPNMTAYQNLEIQRIQRGIPDKRIIERTLERVGLTDTGKKLDPNKAALVLEEKLGTDNYKIMPDGTIRLYDCLDDMEKVAVVLSEEHIVVMIFVDTIWIIAAFCGIFAVFKRAELT